VPAAWSRDAWIGGSCRASGRAWIRRSRVDICLENGMVASTKRLSNLGSLVWSAFGPREDAKRPQIARTGERREPKGYKGFRRIASVGCTPCF
jgi:hypothetical protein